MAVICECDCGWLIDHKQAIDGVYHDTYASTENAANSAPELVHFRCHPDFFEIHQTFMMDSQFDKLRRNANSELLSVDSGCLTGTVRRRTRKRKLPLNEGELAALDFHEQETVDGLSQVKSILRSALNKLIHLGHEKGYFAKRNTDVRMTDNNMAARKAAQTTDTFLVDMVELARHTETDTAATIVLNDKWTKDDHILVDHLIDHRSDRATVRQWMGRHYLLPPRCVFLLSDLNHLTPILKSAHRYDLIVIDPPWQNKSVKRKKKYWTIDNSDLQRLPVNELATDGCLVAVWTTNRQSTRDYVTQELFPRWNVNFITCWYWLKVTTQGVLVCDLDLAMKKPYETLILGRVSHSEASTSKIAVPEARVIASVPSSIHSQKPPLHDILKAYLPDGAKCLELFARNLQPGWTSWGNEVLKHQETIYFEEVHKGELSKS